MSIDYQAIYDATDRYMGFSPDEVYHDLIPSQNAYEETLLHLISQEQLEFNRHAKLQWEADSTTDFMYHRARKFDAAGKAAAYGKAIFISRRMAAQKEGKA